MPRTLAALALLAAAPLPALAQALDETPRLAVMSAFAPEWGALREALEDPGEHVVAGNRFVTGRLEGRDVVLALSGVSMVNAAMTTQMLIDRFELTGIVFSGIAGGVDPGLDIGDVVVAERWGQYRDVILARETDGAFAIPPWMSSDFPAYGAAYTRNQTVMREGLDEPETIFWFEADAAMLETARAVAGEVVLEDCAEECLSEAPEVVVGGNGVSGAAFVDNAEYRAFVFEAFEARVLDMESAAVAHVAHANGVPFVAFRSLSDLAGGGDGANEMNTFLALAAENSAAVVRAFLAAGE